VNRIPHPAGAVAGFLADNRKEDMNRVLRLTLLLMTTGLLGLTAAAGGDTKEPPPPSGDEYPYHWNGSSSFTIVLKTPFGPIDAEVTVTSCGGKGDNCKVENGKFIPK
jgi:hypothetical protein